MRWCRFASIVFCIFTFCNAAIIEPDNLKNDWWDTFVSAPGTIEQKSGALVEESKKIVPQMTDAKQLEAKELIAKIQFNFNHLARAQAGAAVLVPQATPLAASYPIDEALELDQQFRNSSLELKSLKDERHDKLRQIDELQEQLTQVSKGYFRANGAKERTEERYIAGLKLINLHVALLAAKVEWARIENGVRGYEAFLKRLKEELQAAEKRLISTPEEVEIAQKNVQALQAIWQESEIELQGKQQRQVHQSGLGGPESQIGDQELLLAEISELLAHQQFVAGEIKATLAEVLVNPAELDLPALNKRTKEWRRELQEFAKKGAEFSHAAERQVERTSHILSLNPPSDEGGFIMTQPQQIIRLAQSNLLVLRRLESEIDDTDFLLSQLESRTTDLLGAAGRFTEMVGSFAKTFWAGFSDWIETPLFHIGMKPIPFSGLFKFLLILALTFWLSGRVVNWLTHLAISKKRIERSVLYRINRLVYYLLLTIGLIFALISLGFDFSNFLLIAGALGVGLGFGLQTIFNNFMSGLILLFESHIKVGDFIEIASGVRGEVKEINVRSTIIAMNDGLDAIVPNSEMISNRVVNWTLSHPYKRITVPFTVAYGSDKELVRKVVLEAAEKVPETLVKPGFSDPSVTLKEFGAIGLEFELHIWVNEKYSKLPGKSLSDYLWVIDDVLKEHHIDVPFPRTDIKLLKDSNEN